MSNFQPIFAPPAVISTPPAGVANVVPGSLSGYIDPLVGKQPPIGPGSHVLPSFPSSFRDSLPEATTSGVSAPPFSNSQPFGQQRPYPQHGFPPRGGHVPHADAHRGPTSFHENRGFQKHPSHNQNRQRSFSPNTLASEQISSV